MTAVDTPPNLETLVDDIPFPANKTAIVEHAENHDASEEVLDLMQSLPREEYGSLEDLNRDLSLIGEMQGGENLWPSGESRDLPDETTNIVTSVAGKGQKA